MSNEEILARWYSHVKATPRGHVPVLFGGVPAWQLVGKWERIKQNFGLWPREHWPEWVAEVMSEMGEGEEHAN